jgi:hypothetical protein
LVVARERTVLDYFPAGLVVVLVITEQPVAQEPLGKVMLVAGQLTFILGAEAVARVLLARHQLAQLHPVRAATGQRHPLLAHQ